MRTARKTRPSTPAAYTERVNLAIDHILAHLDEPLRLTSLARAAHLSPFHFHRVFQAMVGLTPADFVRQRRIDKALVRMAFGKKTSLTAIALDCGFASSSDFSRAFKQQHGVPPSAFDIAAWRKTHRDELEAGLPTAARLHLRTTKAGPNPDRFRVVIRNLPARTVAYIRVADPYKPGAVAGATERLIAWAERRGVVDNQWLGYQWDNPEITPLAQCRYHVAVEAEDFSPRGEIGRFRFPAMTIAQIELRGGIDLELRALQWIYGSWLPRSGYVPDDHPAFEAWIGRPFAHGTEHFELHAQLPIKRA